MRIRNTSVALAAALLSSCSPGPHLVLLPGQPGEADVPAGCVVYGEYAEVDRDGVCARFVGRVASCGHGVIVGGTYPCFHDDAGQLWLGFGGYTHELWATVGWEACTLDEVALVQDIGECPGP